MTDATGASPPASGAKRPDLESEYARIGAEILGQSAGTDPFAAAVRATRMPMVVSDPRQPDNPVVFANDAFCRLTGYERSEIVGRNCRFLQGPDTNREAVSRIRRAVAMAEAIEIDIRNYRKDGTPFWNRLLLAPVHDAAGALAYFFASQVDVTIERDRLAGLENHNAALLAEVSDRLRAQEESEARLRFATQAGRLGIWEYDLGTKELVTSSLYKNNFGADWGIPFPHENVWAAMHPDDRERVAAALEHSVTTGSDYRVEYRIIKPGRRLAWLEVRAQVMRGRDGTPLRMAGTSLDITDRKQQEVRTRALLELDNQFQVLESGPDLAFAAAEILGRTLEVSRAGYGTIDPVAETITVERDWNAPGIKSLAGMLRFRDFGTYIDDLKRGETVIFADAAADLRTADFADRLTAISARSAINMPITEGGSLVAILYLNHAEARDWALEELDFIREVAHRTRMAVERRRAEQDLRTLAASLESQVATRTRELMEVEASLRQSQKMEAVGQLTGGLAHDFNNLLTGISGSLQLMQIRISQGRFNDVDRYVRVAQDAANRAASLTHRLLAFSRRQTLEPKAVNVNKLIAGMEDLVRRTVGPAVMVEVVGSASLWNTLVDPSQLENALLNLCINARDAMPDGGKLTIETGNRWLDQRAARSRELPPGQYVSLCVTDNGSGIPPEIVSKVFDPFFTTKPIGQGTGLGLSMIYGFARQSGGQVRIYSELGQGTMVCLYLPRHVGEADDSAPASAASQAARSEGGETVLVVDDEPSVRMLVTDVLEEVGYTALEAEDGASALKIIRSDARIDLLVTDVGLPGGINGRQVADAARVIRPKLKVLFITGYAENAAIGHGHLDPGMHVLTKPFAMDTLAHRIKDLMVAG
jgi:PAS domain S-box-containing protein